MGWTPLRGGSSVQEEIADKARKPLDESDAAVGMPSIDTWLEELKSRVSKGHLKGNKKEMEKQYVLNTSWLMFRDFPSMPSDDIDRYLDLCEQVLLGNHSLTSDAGPFPLLPKSDLSPNPPPSWVEYHQSAPTRQAASPIPTPADQAHLLPGEEYESYDFQDVTGTLPERYEVVLNAAAQVVGVKPFDLGIVVELFERRLAKVRKEQSRSRSRSRAASESRRRRGLV
jgi:RNA polymerase I-specific transcription initiation factor RRN7